MTIREAKQMRSRYYALTNPTEDDEFLFTEALKFLIEETKDSDYMLELGGFYYGKRHFDLACRYYELAAEDGNLYAMTCLGYIWYYGRTGVKDFEKAFCYYDKARKMGDPIAAYKVADMYKNGYYVEQDPAEYRRIIEDLYLQVKDSRMSDAPLPEVFTRLARIRAEDGRVDEALDLYDRARFFLEQRIRFNPFFGNLTIMKGLIEDVYRLRPLDPDAVELYDLYELLRRPVLVRFRFEDDTHEVEAAPEGSGIAVRFDGQWFRTVDDFFQKAEIDGELITMLYDELQDFEITEVTE